MKLESKYFDRIRIKPGKAGADKAVADCDWPGCPHKAPHKAPKGRSAEGEYFNFCVDHVRQYNKSYNYFDGMADKDIGEWIRQSATGHRPTWKLGENSWAEAHRAREHKARNGTGPRGFRHDTAFNDPHRMFREHSEGPHAPRANAGRAVRNAERKALDTLGLEPGASRQQIKAQYKLLVKRFHPDANGGSRETEERFRAIVQAHDYLRSIGAC